MRNYGFRLMKLTDRREEARMAGEAPKLHPDEGRLRRWLAEGSDSGLAFLMVLIALAVIFGSYLVDRSLF
jgi:hypothetical protein